MNAIRNFFITAALLFSIAANNSAHAVLVDGAWSGTTLDTTSGLTWVDITETKSLSINMALNSTWMTDLGFKYASRSQVEQLFSNVGIIPGDSVSSGYAALELGLNLGISYSYFSGPVGVASVGRGLYGYDAATQTAGWAQFVSCNNCRSSPLSGWASIGDEFDWSSSLDTRVSSLFGGYAGGQWLVLDPVTTNDVPAPGVLLLLVSGFIALAAVSKCQRRS